MVGDRVESVYIYGGVCIYESVYILSIKQALPGGVESGGIENPEGGAQDFSNIEMVLYFGVFDRYWI